MNELNDLDLPGRVKNYFRNRNVRTIEDIERLLDADGDNVLCDMSRTPNLGKKSLREFVRFVLETMPVVARKSRIISSYNFDRFQMNEVQKAIVDKARALILAENELAFSTLPLEQIARLKFDSMVARSEIMPELLAVIEDGQRDVAQK